MDERVRETYSQDSKATNKNALADPYVKAIRWASDRVGDEGVVAFVTNNGFLDGVAFDGMRKHLAEDFDAIYILDLSGNARKGLKVSDANVFGIRVGVSINSVCEDRLPTSVPADSPQIFYAREQMSSGTKRTNIAISILSEHYRQRRHEWESITQQTSDIHGSPKDFMLNLRPLSQWEAEETKSAKDEDKEWMM